MTVPPISMKAPLIFMLLTATGFAAAGLIVLSWQPQVAEAPSPPPKFTVEFLGNAGSCTVHVFGKRHTMQALVLVHCPGVGMSLTPAYSR